MATSGKLVKFTAIVFAVLFCGRVSFANSLTCFVTPAVLNLRSAHTLEILGVAGDDSSDVMFANRDKPDIYTDGSIVEFSDGTVDTQDSTTVGYVKATLSLPEEEYLQGARFGVHFCDWFSIAARSRAQLLIHNQDTLIPKDGIRTHIVSVGETLQLCVDDKLPKTWKGPIEWVFNGEQPSWLKRWTGSPCIKIKTVETCQAGVYEAYRRICGRHSNQHAFFEVKVRQCPDGFHTAPGCTMTTTTNCQTGYPSDALDGCVCANGFSGATCNTAEEGSFEVTSGTVLFSDLGLHTTGQGTLMCTDGAGCTCTPGWKGIHCDEECDSLSYGPDCALPCAGGTPCDRFTGSGS